MPRSVDIILYRAPLIYPTLAHFPVSCLFQAIFLCSLLCTSLAIFIVYIVKL